MKKLQLKKEVIATMSKKNMDKVKGGGNSLDCVHVETVKCDTQVCPVGIHLTSQCSI